MFLTELINRHSREIAPSDDKPFCSRKLGVETYRYAFLDSKQVVTIKTFIKGELRDTPFTLVDLTSEDWHLEGKEALCFRNLRPLHISSV